MAFEIDPDQVGGAGARLADLGERLQTVVERMAGPPAQRSASGGPQVTDVA